MGRDDSMKVRVAGFGTAGVPVTGVLESFSGHAKLKVFDTGVEDWAHVRDDTNTGPVAFFSLTVNTDTRNMDDMFSDAATSGTTNDILPIVAQRSFLLKADPANTALIRIGNSATTGSNGFPLSAGESLTLEIIRGSAIFAASASGTQTLHFLAI